RLAFLFSAVSRQTQYILGRSPGQAMGPGHARMGELPARDVQSGAQVRVGPQGLPAAVLGQGDDEGQGGVVQRQGGGARHGPGHVADAVVHHLVDHVSGRVMGGRMRGFRTAALVDGHVHQHRSRQHAPDQIGISFGAAAPGTSTAPITRSALRTRSSTASRLAYRVWMRLPYWASSRRSASMRVSSTLTWAPRPTAMASAWLPTTPAPRMVTRPAGTPGTPPSSTPRPPCGVSRQWAPAWMAMRPATSDMGASSGSPPWASLTVS